MAEPEWTVAKLWQALPGELDCRVAPKEEAVKRGRRI